MFHYKPSILGYPLFLETPICTSVVGKTVIKTHYLHYRGLSGFSFRGSFGGGFQPPRFWRWHTDPYDFLCFEDLIPSDIKLRKSTQSTKKKQLPPPLPGTHWLPTFPLLLWSNAAFQPSQNWSCLEIHHHQHSIKNTSQNKSWMSQSKLRRWVTTPTPTIFPHLEGGEITPLILPSITFPQWRLGAPPPRPGCCLRWRQLHGKDRKSPELHQWVTTVTFTVASEFRNFRRIERFSKWWDTNNWKI